MGINYFELALENHLINYRLRSKIAYYLILVFVILTFIASLSIRNFVNSKLSVTFLPNITTSNTPVNIPIAAEELSPETTVKIRVKKGDTINTILRAQGLSKDEVADILKFSEVQKISSSLKIGMPIILDYEFKIIEGGDDDLATEIRSLNKIVFVIDKLTKIELTKEKEKFIIKSSVANLNKVFSKSHTIINSNFVAALKSLGLSTTSIVELVNAYNHQLDFHRQIKPQDTITVITEKFITDNGEFSHYGKVLYASLNASGKEYNIYRYSPDKSDKDQKFFSEDGKSVQRSLLRNPLKLIKITSKFGNRKHPISGYTKLHKGVDFAAPIGTPIYAAGDGVITEAKAACRGYGNFIQLKHTATLSTGYGHLSKFAPDIKNGTKVKQGQIIGYVGNTGHSTGPHLHWEVKIEGKHVNPLSIKTTPQIILAGVHLDYFKTFKKNFIKNNKNLLSDIEVAQSNF